MIYRISEQQPSAHLQLWCTWNAVQGTDWKNAKLTFLVIAWRLFTHLFGHHTLKRNKRQWCLGENIWDKPTWWPFLCFGMQIQLPYHCHHHVLVEYELWWQGCHYKLGISSIVDKPFFCVMFFFRVNTVIDCTGLASYHGFLPTLTRNCIQALTGKWYLFAWYCFVAYIVFL